MSESIEPVAVVGLGNMGMSVVGALLDRGLRVVAVDRDEEKLNALKKGHTLVPEDRAEEVLQKGLQEGRLEVVHGCARAGEWPVIFIAVQTPSEGLQCNYNALRNVLHEVAENAQDGTLVIVGSTVFPGAIAKEVLPALGQRNFDLAYEPVFLRAGHGIDDFLRPGKVVAGVADPLHPPARLVKLLQTLIHDVAPRYVTYAESEWIKVVHNAFMSMKIAFANEVALLCEEYEVDAERVMDVTLDESKYGRLLTRSHTIPGVPFSGPCLPKDADVLRGLAKASKYAAALEPGLCCALRESNLAFRNRLVSQWLELASDRSRPLGIVGMAFRPGFNEMRHSLALDFLTAARSNQIDVVVYDPAFEDVSEEEYVLACRQDEMLKSLRPLFRPLEEVWSSQGLLLNRHLDPQERQRIQHLPVPGMIDLYRNNLQ